MKATGLAALLLALLPRAATACATCITSPFGDQTYNWAYLGLILLPFALVGVFATVLTCCWRQGRAISEARPDDSPTREETR